MRLVLGTIFKKAEQMLGFFYVCPLEDQGPLPLRASMRSRGSWRVLVLVALRASVRSRASWHILVLVALRASMRSRASWRVHAPVPLRGSMDVRARCRPRTHVRSCRSKQVTFGCYFTSIATSARGMS